MSAFVFAFVDEASDETPSVPAPVPEPAAPRTAFPLPNQPQLPARRHELAELLAGLPSRLAFSLVDGGVARRELWDVRVQLMAERNDSDGDEPGLGPSDLRTGLYEGGFKSWESSLDLANVLTEEAVVAGPLAVVELGCGTALPSLALFRRAIHARSVVATSPESPPSPPLTFVLADYYSTVLELVTAPNMLLTWAVATGIADMAAGELEPTVALVSDFLAFLQAANIQLVFFSGGWGPALDKLLLREVAAGALPLKDLLVVAAETIYSLFALHAFAASLVALLRGAGGHARALVAAKRLYFGVGGSLDEFVATVRAQGVVVRFLREETEGVRRAVVECRLDEFGVKGD